MSPRLHQLPLPFDATYWCHDCAVPVPLTVAPAGSHGFYLGYICSVCQVAADILGVLATRELAQALLSMLDHSPQTTPELVRPRG
jgi:hypothetical protein